MQLRLNDAVKEQFLKPPPRQLVIPDIEPASEPVLETSAAPRRKSAPSSAASRKTSKKSSTGYVLKTVEDPNKARPSDREAELHRRIEKYPKARIR